MERIESLLEKSKALYADDERERVRRVVDLSEWLAGHEGADIEILLAASILHAAHPRMGRNPEESFAKRRSFPTVTALLSASGYGEDETKWVLAILEESVGEMPFSVEAAILMDAVTLDGLGAAALLRGESRAARVIGKFSAMGEDPGEAIFPSPANMRTPTAQLEATRRIGFMKLFVEQLRGELSPYDLLTDKVPRVRPLRDRDPEVSIEETI